MMKRRLIHLLFALALPIGLTPSTSASVSEVVVDHTAVFLDVKIFWDNFANDLDLFLYTPADEIAGASQDVQALSGEGKECVAVDNPDRVHGALRPVGG